MAVKLRVVFLTFLFFFISADWAPTAQGLQTSDTNPRGLVVERVRESSDAERAGLVGGDVILSWSRGQSGGPVDSPFELSRIEIEELPLGEITLTGKHGDRDQSWRYSENTTPTTDEGAWGISVRPALDSQLLATYREARQAEENKKSSDAVAVWQRAIAEAKARNLSAWVSAWLLLQSASDLADGDKWEAADKACQQAVDLGLSSSYALRVAASCGWVFYQREHGQAPLADKYYQQAMELAQKEEPKSLTVAQILKYLSGIAKSRHQWEKAQDLAKAAIPIIQARSPHSLTFATALNRVGVGYQTSGELNKSEQYLRDALKIREEMAPESRATASALESLGNTLSMEGDLDEAEADHLRALALWQKLAPGSSWITGILIDLSNDEDDLGDWDTAEKYLRQALAIQRKNQPHSSATAASLNNLGELLRERGQLAEAEESYIEALSIKQEINPGSLNVANTLGNIAGVRLERGDLSGAEPYLWQALAIEKSTPNSLQLENLYVYLGKLFLQRHDLAQAEEFYRKSLAIGLAQSPNARTTSNIWQSLGDLAQDKNDVAEAEHDYEQALKVREGLGHLMPGYADALLSLAEVARKLKQWDLAEQHYRDGFEALDSQMTRVGGGEDARAGFRARYEGFQKNYVDLLVQQGKIEAAFTALEHSRARMLLETLEEARINIHSGVDVSLTTRARRLQANIAAKSDRRIRLMSQDHTQQQQEDLDKEIRDLLDQYAQVESQIHKSSPNYAALKRSEALTAEQVRPLLDADTVLLEYSLGTDRSYVFLATSSAVAAHLLPARAQVEEAARALYESITARNRTLEGESAIARRARVKKADQEYARLSTKLSKLILGPVAAQIEGKRLLVVSDGALQYIPFAALTSPPSLHPSPLVMTQEIVNLPSASILTALRRERKERAPAAKAVAVMADPVFSVRDSRLNGRIRLPVSNTREVAAAADVDNAANARERSVDGDQLTRSIRDVGLLSLSRLPFTRSEADAAISWARPDERMEALDFDASRATAISGELSKYRIVHFATHGLLDSQHPEFSGLVLSLVDKEGKPQIGFLGLEDIYNLDLPADLVVLSACQTGLGKEIDGEGLIGLTRGFMYAGAERVVASLWNVSDAATAELMKYFYQGMLHDDLSPAAALRRAQIQMWRQTRWKSPYYWAAFQIQGDWN